MIVDTFKSNAAKTSQFTRISQRINRYCRQSSNNRRQSSIGRLTLWERACSRKRSVSQHLLGMTHRLRRNAARSRLAPTGNPKGYRPAPALAP
ncbi:hypothetical protein PkoCFBP13504_21580 [Pseudomonas koreensis]|nr:hypothetical protein PkoCFBP13504_21580 [Pseudomonas koreensis]